MAISMTTMFQTNPASTSPRSARPLAAFAVACSLIVPVMLAGAVTGSASAAGQAPAGGDGAREGAGEGAGRRAPVTTSSSIPALNWQLEFQPGPLRLFVDPVDGTKYWYFTYKVVNRTGRDRMWAPRFEFFTDEGEIKVSGKSVPTRVTDEVATMLGNPLLEDQNEILGDILVGEEHAKEGLVIWPAGPADTNEFSIFVTGVSGKVRKVADPKTGAPRAERWTLRFNYLVPGDATPRGSEPVTPVLADQDVKEGAERRADDVGVWIWR